MATDDREQQFDRALARHLRDASSEACPDAEILAAYHERTLSLGEMAKWKEHIATCERCQETLALVEQTESVDSEEWKERDTVVTLQRAAAEPALASAMRMEEALPVAKAEVAQVSRRMRRPRAQWKWLVPVGAVAAGAIVWIGSVEVQKQRRQAAESVQIAENRRAAEPPPMAQPAAPRKENEPEKALRDESAARAVVPKTAAKQAVPMGAPSMIAQDEGPKPAPQLDKKKDTTGQGFGNGIGAPAPAPPNVAASSAMEKGKSSIVSTENQGAMIAGGPARAPTSGANQASEPSPQKGRGDISSKLSAGSAGGNLSIITGTVLDPSGAGISGAVITAIDTSIGSSKTAVADAAGRFQLTDLPSDQYRLIVAHAGFAQSEQMVALRPKQNEQLNIQLKLGSTSQTVEVSAATSAINSSAAEVSKDSASSATELSMNGRNHNALIQLAASNPQYIASPDQKAGWRVGDAGKIERTTDHGKTWKAQTSGVSADLRTGSATSGKVCWVIGKAGTILLTADGGKHWKQITSPISEDLGGIHAVDALHASIWDVPNRKSYETTNGGASWKRTANE